VNCFFKTVADCDMLMISMGPRGSVHTQLINREGVVRSAGVHRCCSCANTLFNSQFSLFPPFQTTTTNPKTVISAKTHRRNAQY